MLRGTTFRLAATLLASGVLLACQRGTSLAPDDAGLEAGVWDRGPLRCDGQRLEELRDGDWIDVGGCAVDGPNACGPGDWPFWTTPIHHWDGGPGAGTACLPVGDIYDVVGTGPGDVWIASSAGVWRWDGTLWTATSNEHLVVEGDRLRIADVARPWLATARSIRRYDGVTWQEVTPPELAAPDGIIAVLGMAVGVGDRAWLVGRSDGRARAAHFDGASWAWVSTPPTGHPLALAAREGEVWAAWAVAPSAAEVEPVVLARWSGGGFGAVSDPLSASYHPAPLDFLARGEDDAWLLDDSALSHWDGTAWTTDPLLGSGNLVEYEGEVLSIRRSAVSRWTGTGWEPVTDGLGAMLATRPYDAQARAVGTSLWITPSIAHGG